MLSLPVEFDFYNPKEAEKGVETYPDTKGISVYAPFDGILNQGPADTVFVTASANDVAPFLPPVALRTGFWPVRISRPEGSVKAGDLIGRVFGRNLTSVTEVGDTPITLETIYSAAQGIGLRVKDPGVKDPVAKEPEVEDLSRRKKGNPYALLAVGCLSAASISLLLWGKSK